MDRLSLCVVTFNEEDRIGRCLASVDFADEILVVDSHSTDQTRAIAEVAGARVIERDWPGHVEQKAYAVEHAVHDHVLCLDADEWLSDELAAEIRMVLDGDWGGEAGFSFPRLSEFRGRWMRHGNWWPDRQLRLFDRRRAKWGGRNPHDKVQTDGLIRRLRSPLLHAPYRSHQDHLDTIDWYSALGARELHATGRRAAPWDPAVHAVAHWMKAMIWKCGFLDGGPGWTLAGLGARNVWLKYSRLRALNAGAEPISDAPRGTSTPAIPGSSSQEEQSV